MRAAFLLLFVFVLSAVMSCTRSSQSPQRAQQDNQAPVQAQPSVAKSDRGTPGEAEAMLKNAVEHYGSAGREQALADFTARKPPFGDRDLYVFCLDPTATCLLRTAHSHNTLADQLTSGGMPTASRWAKPSRKQPKTIMKAQ